MPPVVDYPAVPFNPSLLGEEDLPEWAQDPQCTVSVNSETKIVYINLHFDATRPVESSLIVGLLPESAFENTDISRFRNLLEQMRITFREFVDTEPVPLGNPVFIEG
ncbi:MAG: hypothetical protein ACTSUE_22845 [Promethearchaeota archaeon]